RRPNGGPSQEGEWGAEVKTVCAKQGSADWYRARLGIPTSSNFHRILTPKTLELSSQAKEYQYQLLSEWLTGVPHGSESASAFMQRGTQLEPEAAAWYAYDRGVGLEEIGCVLRDDEMVACSPDRLVGEDGGLEIKAPAASTHVRYMVEGLTGYTSQVQGALWLTGRSYWDLLSYHPDMPAVVVRHERDEKHIAALERAVGQFVEELLAAREALLARGCTPTKLRLTHNIAEPEPF
ncbi:MAG: YqaJ viral recombinase family protein, partial [Rhodospirillaceae bacterium]